MIRNTLLAASALVASTLTFAPTAQSQSSTFFLYCVDLQTSWAANIMIDAREGVGAWSNILYVVTDPGRRCQRGQPGATQLRFTIRGNVGGPLRQLCQVTALGDRAATLQVSGSQENPSCVLVQ